MRKFGKQVITYLINKSYTSRQAAKLLKADQGTVLSYANQFGLKFDKNIPKRADTVETPIVRKLVKRGYSDIEISKILNINRQSVGRIIRKKNFQRIYKVSLNKRQKAILIGTLLGDASLNKVAQTRIMFSHSLKQKEYCLWKAEQLFSLDFRNHEFQRFDNRTKKTYSGITCYSLATQTLNEWFDLLYVPKKIIPNKLLQYYNNLSLAIHFMDDGYKNTSTYGLATNSFSREDLDKFNNMCEQKFGIKWTIRKDHTLYLPFEYKNTFTNLIKEFIHPELMYKLH